MAGKRILDAAAFFQASRSIARKHVALRSQQLDTFSKTSTLAQAIKSQTDRVTSTAPAVSALAQRLNSSAPTTPRDQQRQRHDHGSIPRTATTKGNTSASTISKEGLEQDHFYERSERNTTTEPLPEEDLGVKQEKADRYPLPDGTIPPANDNGDGAPRDQDVYFQRPRAEKQKEPLSEADRSGAKGQDEGLQPASSSRSTIPDPTSSTRDLSPDQARKFQRQAEFQIPSSAAEPPSNGSSDAVSAEMPKDHDTDVFSLRSQQASPVLSSLPRVKIPKHSEDIQGSDESVKDRQINSDVFYSSEAKSELDPVPSQEAVPEQAEIPDGINADVFHSPKVARLLGAKDRSGRKPEEMGMKAARNTPVDKTSLKDGTDQDTFNVRDTKQTSTTKPDGSLTSEPKPSSDSAGDDVHDLAKAIAKDADSASPSASEAVESSTPSETVPYQMHESRVPSSRFGRLWHYGGLATGMAFGAVSESFRRATGSDVGAGGSLMLSAANMDRLVAKLSRMRGAALKLGQMMSFQDSKMLPPAIQQVLQRVQDSADYMPPSQRDRVLTSSLGADWRSLFSTFDEVPIAAASIGQVHSAILASNQQPVAVKIQYPGVANSIDSDLSNLSILLHASRLLPKGLYLDKTIANARTELAWECDYEREASAAKRFRALLADDTDVFTVPDIYDEACGPQVLTMRRMHGVGVTKIADLPQEKRDWIATQILRLCLREMCEFRYMQTDPNWTNFLYNQKDQKIELLDFGASRAYPPSFIDPYIRLLVAASRADTSTITTLSIQLGYLTGHESSTMRDAHVNSILALAEPFALPSSSSSSSSTPEFPLMKDESEDLYDFSAQTITERVRSYIPVMLRERLAPPPEETYSLHRKLSGAFLLCQRLGARVPCRRLFVDAVKKVEGVGEGEGGRER
ncbi:MAG: hypothetical protein M1817_006463 [Caeruleum heppii]|nr:MAG: hypothetical protein M1817_006463 [Caeruleum heppii]